MTITIRAFLVNELGDIPKLRAIDSYRTFNSSIKEDLRESAELENDLLRQEVLFTEAGDVIKIIEDELGHTLLRDYHSTLDIPINIHDKVDYTPDMEDALNIVNAVINPPPEDKRCERCNRHIEDIAERYDNGAILDKGFRSFKDDECDTLFPVWECLPCYQNYDYMPGDSSEELPPYAVELGNFNEKKFTDLDLSPSQQKEVIEWLAVQYRYILMGLGVDECVGYKSYDPLTIEGNVAHSYVFDLKDGGRHHEFKDYNELVDDLTNEVIKDTLDNLPTILDSKFIVH